MRHEAAILAPGVEFQHRKGRGARKIYIQKRGEREGSVRQIRARGGDLVSVVSKGNALAA